tara:strand:+ start:763 stop:903 length:141 start_codon:yes stop_codon:yes gene_type:complete
MWGGVFCWIDFSLLRFFSSKPALMPSKSGEKKYRGQKNLCSRELKF